MNELGLRLAWSAIQVSPVLLAAAAVHAIASRQSPATAAWVASVGLGLALAVGLLSPGFRGPVAGRIESPVVSQIPPIAARSTATVESLSLRVEDTPGQDRAWLTLAALRSAWHRLDRTVAEPAARVRPWGTALAVVGLVGAGAGLLRLIAGIWAVHLLRGRGHRVDDPELNQLLEELRTAAGCRRQVEIRETPDLTAPATAGWRSAAILLPADWRSWDSDERRAVLAHELGHVDRNDYLMEILARAATALYFYHPLMHWLAGSLRLEQELAADAFGARFAGGRSRYLLSLSRLALRQDGRVPHWPARAFLPARGTLIRRIGMLRDETKAADRPWSAMRRALAAVVLVAVAAGAATLHGPARAGDSDRPAASGIEAGRIGRAEKGQSPGTLEPFELSYVIDEDSQAVWGIRPAAALGRSGMGGYRTMLNVAMGGLWAKAADQFKFDPTKPGQKPPRIELFEQVTASMRVYRVKGKKPNGRLAVSTITVRTTEPVDWVALARMFKLNVTEKRDGDRVYYGVKHTPLAPETFFFCPDPRTLVLSGEEMPAAAEKRLLAHLRRATAPAAPVFAQAKDWDRLVRGLGLLALDNRGGRLAKPLRGDGTDEEMLALTSMIDDAEFWALGVDNDDQLTIRGVGTCANESAGELTARAIVSVLDRARKQVDTPGARTKPRRAAEEKADRMGRALLNNLTVERVGNSVLVRCTGLGTIADFASLVAARVVDL